MEQENDRLRTQYESHIAQQAHASAQGANAANCLMMGVATAWSMVSVMLTVLEAAAVTLL